MTCSGVYTALVTPFDQQGKIDIEGFRFHIKRQKEAKVAGLVVLGTSGETATLSAAEKETLLKIARQEAGSLHIMAGCGSSSTAQTLENLQMAERLGCDSALVITPFYNKPTQEGLFRHYEALANASKLPIFLYNNPSRTGVNLEIETLKRIVELPRICGIKESSSDFNQLNDILFFIKEARPEFSLLCGDDSFTYSFMTIGADGVISGGANLIPHQMVALVNACRSHDFEKARKLHLTLIPLFNALSLESNPIPLKAALQLAKLPSGYPRAPLTPLQPSYLPILEEAWSSVTKTF